MIEAVAVASVINQATDEETAKNALKSLSTFPKKLFPFRLTDLVKWVCAVSAGSNPTGTPSLSVATAEPQPSLVSASRSTPVNVVSR
eukprot:scaffold48553_cov38-Prasinocladus_malaysianus.AAC.1